MNSYTKKSWKIPLWSVVWYFTIYHPKKWAGWYPSCKKNNSANFRDNLAAASAATSKKTHKSWLIEQKEKTQNSQDLKRKYEKTSSTIGLLKKHLPLDPHFLKGTFALIPWASLLVGVVSAKWPALREIGYSPARKPTAQHPRKNGTWILRDFQLFVFRGCNFGKIFWDPHGIVHFNAWSTVQPRSSLLFMIQEIWRSSSGAG